MDCGQNGCSSGRSTVMNEEIQLLTKNTGLGWSPDNNFYATIKVEKWYIVQVRFIFGFY